MEALKVLLGIAFLVLAPVTLLALCMKGFDFLSSIMKNKINKEDKD